MDDYWVFAGGISVNELEVNKIQRYAIINTYDEEGCPALMTMPDGTGKWVKWEDVKLFLEAMSKIPPKIDIDSGSDDAIDKEQE